MLKLPMESKVNILFSLKLEIKDFRLLEPLRNFKSLTNNFVSFLERKTFLK